MWNNPLKYTDPSGFCGQPVYGLGSDSCYSTNPYTLARWGWMAQNFNMNFTSGSYSDWNLGGCFDCTRYDPWGNEVFVNANGEFVKEFRYDLIIQYIGDQNAPTPVVDSPPPDNNVQKGGILRKVRTFLANALLPGHYQRDETNAMNLAKLGLENAEFVDDDTLKNFEKSSYIWKMFHDFGDGNKGNQRLMISDKNNALYGTEIILDVNNRIIRGQPMNAASFNRSPNNKVGHLFKDVIPYLLFGNNSDDPTNIFQRVGRFLQVPKRKFFEDGSEYGQ